MLGWDQALEGAPVIYELLVTLRDTEPRVWRELRVPAALRMDQLHRVLQVSFGWEDRHLHEFRFADRTIGRPDFEDDPLPELEDERRIRLNEVMRRTRSPMSYCYDFGEGWDHEIALQGTHPAGPDDAAPRLISGSGMPFEDCGGPHGLGQLREILAKPRHRKHRDMRAWVGPAYDPDVCDIDAINRRLKRLAPRARKPVGPAGA
jgi:hypothetical protein